MVQESTLPTPAGVVGDTYCPSPCIIFLQLFRQFQVKWSGKQGSREGVQQFVPVGTWAQAWLPLFRDGGTNWNMTPLPQTSHRESCLLSSFLSKPPSVAVSHNNHLKVRPQHESKYIQARAEMFRAERPFKGDAGEQMAEPLLPHIWATVANRKADGHTAAVQSFVWLLNYFLKWTHQDAMWSENGGCERCLSDQECTKVKWHDVRFKNGIIAAPLMFF